MFHGLLKKLQKKGLRGSLRMLCERYFYRHWELVILERDLSLPLPLQHRLGSWPERRIDHALLPTLERYFVDYVPTIRDLLKTESAAGYAYMDHEGHAACIAWVSERDYYDAHLYRCWVRVPPDCIYQFAGEVAVPYRSRGLPLLVLERLWDRYRRLGFRVTRALVNTNNRPALLLHARLGFQEAGESIHTYCLFGCIHFSRRKTYLGKRLPSVRQRSISREVA